jgi:hypothetical protein
MRKHLARCRLVLAAASAIETFAQETEALGLVRTIPLPEVIVRGSLPTQSTVDHAPGSGHFLQYGAAAEFEPRNSAACLVNDS